MVNNSGHQCYGVATFLFCNCRIRDHLTYLRKQRDLLTLELPIGVPYKCHTVQDCAVCRTRVVATNNTVSYNRAIYCRSCCCQRITNVRIFSKPGRNVRSPKIMTSSDPSRFEDGHALASLSRCFCNLLGCIVYVVLH